MKKGLVFNRAMSAHPYNIAKLVPKLEIEEPPIAELESTKAFESVQKRVQSAVGALVKHQLRKK